VVVHVVEVDHHYMEVEQDVVLIMVIHRVVLII
jgi:hypothetical protein